MGKWTKQQILQRIANGECPSELGRRGGRNAHKIQDMLNNKGPGLYCKTAAHGWHLATPREKNILNPKGRNQQRPMAEQLMLI